MVVVTETGGQVRVNCTDLDASHALRLLEAAVEAVEGMLSPPSVTVVLDGCEYDVSDYEPED